MVHTLDYDLKEKEGNIEGNCSHHCQGHVLLTETCYYFHLFLCPIQVLHSVKLLITC